MRTMASIAAVAALSCPLMAGAAGCPAGQQSVPSSSTSLQLIAQLEGVYKLSNGRRLELLSQDERLWADFGKWNRVPLDEVGPNRFASPGGAVTVELQPESDTILVRYPSDARGRLAPVC